MTRAFRPVEVMVDDEPYYIHTGGHRHARIYRRLKDGSLRRVEGSDPVLLKIAAQLRADVDAHKAASEKDDKRRRGRIARFFRWIGSLLARAWFAMLPPR